MHPYYEVELIGYKALLVIESGVRDQVLIPVICQFLNFISRIIEGDVGMYVFF